MQGFTFTIPRMTEDSEHTQALWQQHLVQHLLGRGGRSFCCYGRGHHRRRCCRAWTPRPGHHKWGTASPVHASTSVSNHARQPHVPALQAMSRTCVSQHIPEGTWCSIVRGRVWMHALMNGALRTCLLEDAEWGADGLHDLAAAAAGAAGGCGCARLDAAACAGVAGLQPAHVNLLAAQGA